MAYSTIEDVLNATGLSKSVIQNISGKSEQEVDALIEDFIDKADAKIKAILGVPITIRKEYHFFNKNKTVELGPYEDEFEFFSSYDPTNCVEKVYALYRDGTRVKLPYPKDCDSLTEDVTNYSSSNCVLTKESSIFKCGTASIKAEFQAGGSFSFPSKLDKNIKPWTYIAFWFRTSDATATFTIKLYDKDGNYNYMTFTVDLADKWQIVSLEINDFTGDIDWGDTNLQKIEISSDKACTVYFDNFNFNDGYFWTYPEGLICWSDPDSKPYGEIEVTYSFDPYKLTIPENLNTASAKFAGVLLLDFVLGHRQQVTAFIQEADTLDTRPDRETLEVTRARLLNEAQVCLATIGYKTYEGM